MKNCPRCNCTSCKDDRRPCGCGGVHLHFCGRRYDDNVYRCFNCTCRDCTEARISSYCPVCPCVKCKALKDLNDLKASKGAESQLGRDHL
jgi:hypothetical protein